MDIRMDISALEINTSFDIENGSMNSLSFLDSSASESLKMTRMIVKQILVPVVVSAGIIGNVLNVIVLRNRKMRSSTNIYLFSLAICDMLFLIFVFSLSFIDCNKSNQSAAAFYFIPRARVLSDLFGNTAVWLTVAFTIERYIGVCFPMKGKVWCTVRKAKVLSLVVFVVCFINTLPVFFEREIKKEEFIVNSTVTVTYSCQISQFGRRESYTIGYYWWYVTFFTFIPFVFLFVFNSILIKSVWQANKRRNQLSNFNVIGENARQSNEQQKVTTMLITVVVIFLICQLPWTILLMYSTYLSANNLPQPKDFLRIAGNICNLLVQINASGNFLLYSYFSSRFRRTFKKLFCAWRKKMKRRSRSANSTWKSSRYNSSTTTTTTSSCRSKRGTIASSSKRGTVSDSCRRIEVQID